MKMIDELPIEILDVELIRRCSNAINSYKTMLNVPAYVNIKMCGKTIMLSHGNQHCHDLWLIIIYYTSISMTRDYIAICTPYLEHY